MGKIVLMPDLMILFFYAAYLSFYQDFFERRIKNTGLNSDFHPSIRIFVIPASGTIMPEDEKLILASGIEPSIIKEKLVLSSTRYVP